MFCLSISISKRAFNDKQMSKVFKGKEEEKNPMLHCEAGNVLGILIQITKFTRLQKICIKI